METSKRMRSINWTEQEKKILKRLVLARAHVLERKDNSTHSLQRKKHAWGEVLERFNMLSPAKRDMMQLHNQWRNMKNRAKKLEYASRRARMLTDEGPPPHSPSSEEAFPQEFTVDSNCYDSDMIYGKEMENSQQNPTITFPETSDAPVVVESLQSNTPPSHNKKYKKKKSDFDCSCTISHEHQLFMLAYKAREHTMRNEHKAHELKIRQGKEIHDKKMAILSLQEAYWRDKVKK